MIQTAQTTAAALDHIAAFAVSLRTAQLPAAVVAKVKDCVLDALSACLTAGSSLEGTCAVTIGAAPAGTGVSTLIGTHMMGSPSGAAFVNGTNAASTSRSDTHPASASHPGPIVIAAVLALAEAQRASGATVIESIVSGYETMCRLGLALVTPEFAAVFRPTGMIGPTAGAVAAARVLGLTAQQIRNAASLATQTASGLNEWANAGTSELAFHSGFAARNSVDAALLAQAGAVSAPTILEGKSGLLAGFGALARAPLLTARLGDEFKILEIIHKPAPVCIYVQTPAQLARAIAQRHHPKVDDIHSVEIRVSRAAAAYPGCDDSGPIKDAQAAKLSIQFGVASVLVSGGIFDNNWRDFTNAHANALAARSRVIVHNDLGAAGSGADSTGIKLQLASGAVIEEIQTSFVPMSKHDLLERFMSVAVPKLGQEQSEQIVAMVGRLDELTDIAQLTRLLRVAA